jgi:hypothetical protein
MMVPRPIRRSGSFAKNALITVGVLCFLLGVGVVYALLHQPPQPLLILSFDVPSQVFVGGPANVSITITNSSTQSITGAVLSVSLPPNLSIVGQPSDQKAMTQNLDSLDPGASQTIELRMIATGGSGSVSHVTGMVLYSAPKDPKTPITSQGSGDVVIGDPVIDISLGAPQGGILGVPITLSISYANTSHNTLSDVGIVLSAPPAFVLQSSSLPLADGVWSVGPLAPGVHGTIFVQGYVSASSSDTFSFSGAAEVGFSGQHYLLGSHAVNVAVTQPPLSLFITADASSTYISHTGDDISYTLSYRNNAFVSLQGVQIMAKLSGAMFDFSGISTNGSFDSVNDVVLWTPSTVPALSNLAPGASGNVQFSAKLKNAFPIHAAADKNYSVNVFGTITSPTVTPGVTATSTSFSADFSTKVGGGAVIVASGYHYDAASGIPNAGPFPPIVNEPTQYTIHWTIVNQATDENGVTVSAALPAGIAFTGNVKSNGSTTPHYNPLTGLVSWQLPSIPANAGVKGPAAQAIFQVESTPSLPDVGGVITLLQQTTLTATDAFTGILVQSTASPITSQIQDDLGTSVQDRNVRAQ